MWGVGSEEVPVGEDGQIGYDDADEAGFPGQVFRGVASVPEGRLDGQNSVDGQGHNVVVSRGAARPRVVVERLANYVLKKIGDNLLLKIN